MVPENKNQMAQVKKKSNFKKILIIILILYFLRVVITADYKNTNNSTTSTKTEDIDNKKSKNEQQQEDFKKLYQDTLDIIYPMKKSFYVTSNILTITSRDNSYDAFKKSEKIYQDCSVYFTMATVPTSLNDYESEIKESFKELSNVCVMLQNHCKYFADYINTNNLESLRKSDEIIDQEPIKMISNASGRLVYGVGEKIGLDPKPFDEAYKEISDRIPKEFEQEIKN